MASINNVQLRKQASSLIFIIFLAALGLMFVIRKEQTPSERICQNLIKARYLSSTDECVISDYTPDYMKAYFPINVVDIAYVRAGMEGFELYAEIYPTNCHKFITCLRLDYVIESRFFLLGDETYELIFGNDILIDTQWHD